MTAGHLGVYDVQELTDIITEDIMNKKQMQFDWIFM